MPRVDLTAKYIELAQQLGQEMRYAHGWRRRVAERLGIDESMLSRILSGHRKVGWRLAERATENLGLDPGYFSEAASSARQSPAVLNAILAKFDAGKATTADVYDLARVVAGAPGVLQAQAILKTRPPKSEQQVGALFLAASKLIALLRNDEETVRKKL